MKRQLICSVLCIALLGSLLPFNRIQAQDGNQKSYGKAGVDYVEGEVIAFVEGGAKALASKARTANSFSVENIMDVTEANNDTKQRNAASSTKSLVLVKGQKDVGTLIDELEKNDNVEYAEPNYYVKGYENSTKKEPSDPYYPYQWQLGNSKYKYEPKPVDTNVSKVWDKIKVEDPTDTKNTPVVAVLDSGVDYTHVDLNGVMWAQGDSIQALKDLNGGKYGYDAFYKKGDPESEKEPMDSEIGHGTHCAGIISAQWNAVGGAGVSPNAKIMGLRFLSPTNEGTTLDAIKSYNYMQTAKKAGVNLVAINNSWGPSNFDGYQMRSLNTAVTSIGKLGVISVFAAGNENVNLDANIMSYTNSPYAILVGAIESSGYRAPFSNYGQKSVDVFAPGVNILSTVPAINASYKPAFLPYLMKPEDSIVLYNDFENENLDYKLSLIKGKDEIIRTSTQRITSGFCSDHSLGISLDGNEIKNGEEFYIQLDIENIDINKNINPAKPLHMAASLSFTNALFLNQIEVQYMDSKGEWKLLESNKKGEHNLPMSISIPVFDKNWNQITTQLNDFSIYNDVSKSISLRFSAETTAQMSGKGENAMFRIDDFGLGQETRPYAYASGTSMAAPFVSGVVSLLASSNLADINNEKLSEERAKKIIAHIKGGVTRLQDSDLNDKGLSQGFLDVAAAFDDNQLVPVLDEVAKEGETYILSGNFFGDTQGTLQVGDFNATIKEWNKQKITFTLADEIAGQQEFIVTTKAEPKKFGHNYFNISSNSLDFESYNAPNLEYGTLLGNDDYKLTSENIVPLAMSAANEQIFRLGYIFETDEKVMEIYDIKTNKWRKGTLPQNYNSEYFEVSMTAGLTKLYLLGYPSDDSDSFPTLYTYDTTNEQWTSVTVDTDYGAGLVVYQDKLLAIGGESIIPGNDIEVKSEATSKVSIIDPITGKMMGNLPDLPHGNSGFNVCASGNNIMVTRGYSSQTMKKLKKPFETYNDTIVFDGKAWKNYDDKFFANTNPMFDMFQTLGFAIGATNSGLIVTGPVSGLGNEGMVDTFTFNMKARASWSPRSDVLFSQTKITPIMGVSYGDSFYVIGNSADKKEPILFRSTKIDYTGPTSDPKGAEEKPDPIPTPEPTPPGKIDPIPSPNVEKPKDTNTGDTTRIASYIGIAALAIVALLGIGYKKKIRSKK